MDIAMVPAVIDNNEVVVIGYGTQKKSHLTGAVSKYKNEKIDETPNSRLDQALQGKIAGVQVQNISSEAGADPKIRVRGISSINAGANPLVVVDGHPVPDGLAFVNMADVESVEVLKDAASSAIYGSRGASGVIIITTKSGKADKPKYSVKFSTGAKTQVELYPMMSTSEYTNLLFYEAALKSRIQVLRLPQVQVLLPTMNGLPMWWRIRSWVDLGLTGNARLYGMPMYVTCRSVYRVVHGKQNIFFPADTSVTRA